MCGSGLFCASAGHSYCFHTTCRLRACKWLSARSTAVHSRPERETPVWQHAVVGGGGGGGDSQCFAAPVSCERMKKTNLWRWQLIKLTFNHQYFQSQKVDCRSCSFNLFSAQEEFFFYLNLRWLVPSSLCEVLENFTQEDQVWNLGKFHLKIRTDIRKFQLGQDDSLGSFTVGSGLK